MKIISVLLIMLLLNYTNYDVVADITDCPNLVNGLPENGLNSMWIPLLSYYDDSYSQILTTPLNDNKFSINNINEGLQSLSISPNHNMVAGIYLSPSENAVNSYQLFVWDLMTQEKTYAPLEEIWGLFPLYVVWHESSEIIVVYASRAMGFESIPFIRIAIPSLSREYIYPSKEFIYPFYDSELAAYPTPMPLLTEAQTNFENILYFSPRGNYVVYRAYEDGNFNYHVVEVSSGRILDIETPYFRNWASDDVLISGENSQSAIAYLVSVNQGTERKLIDIDMPSSWSGIWFYAQALSPTQNMAIASVSLIDGITQFFLANLQTGESQPFCLIKSSGRWGFEWSPDGKYIVMAGSELENPDQAGIYIYSVEDNVFFKIYDEWGEIIGWVKSAARG